MLDYIYNVEPERFSFLRVPKILLQNDRLTKSEQESALEKAKQLLVRFRNSEFFRRCESADLRLHEQPFSLPRKNYAINGVIDLLLKEGNEYTVIDFKTDVLKTLSELNEAVKRHGKQLNGYRKAVRMALGVNPRVQICFLDYCGEVACIPVGENSPIPDEEPVITDDDIVPEEDESP